jgi:hypothetical protein
MKSITKHFAPKSAFTSLLSCLFISRDAIMLSLPSSRRRDSVGPLSCLDCGGERPSHSHPIEPADVLRLGWRKMYWGSCSTIVAAPVSGGEWHLIGCSFIIISRICIARIRLRHKLSHRVLVCYDPIEKTSEVEFIHFQHWTIVWSVQPYNFR